MMLFNFQNLQLCVSAKQSHPASRAHLLYLVETAQALEPYLVAWRAGRGARSGELF